MRSLSPAESSVDTREAFLLAQCSSGSHLQSGLHQILYMHMRCFLTLYTYEVVPWSLYVSDPCKEWQIFLFPEFFELLRKLVG
jgi:hypothetical protein